MSERMYELVFRFVPRKLSYHLLHGLIAAVKHAGSTKKYNEHNIRELFADLIDCGLGDLLRSVHHGSSSLVSIFVTESDYKNIVSCDLNHHGTLRATGGLAVDLVGEPELLATNFAQHAHCDWAINLRKEGVPVCVWINGSDNSRRHKIAGKVTVINSPGQ